MKTRRLFAILPALIVSLLLVGSVLAASIDPVNRTAASTNLFVDWDTSNPEMITGVQWKGSANLTNTAVIAGCPDPLEFFGNSWVSIDEGTPAFIFKSLVGWGTTGTWNAAGASQVRIRSISEGCFGSAGVPVDTRYQLFDHGPRADTLAVVRRFRFGGDAFPYDLRPYIPRLYPSSSYSQVLHPDAAGTALLTEDPSLCPFGCEVADWDGSWFAIHDPGSGLGLIVLRQPSGYAASLWVDQDGASDTTAPSVLLQAPAAGFRGSVTERETLCFYDDTTWTPDLALPDGCQ
ncbi:MAG: hypothetical protein P8129_11395 [Anaerolineae bacterium]